MDTKYLNSGDAVTYELQGLTPLTTYYIAIPHQPLGRRFSLSEVKKATTNAGPKVPFDKTSLELAVDATKGKVAQGDFTIANNGEGLLKSSRYCYGKGKCLDLCSFSSEPRTRCALQWQNRCGKGCEPPLGRASTPS